MHWLIEILGLLHILVARGFVPPQQGTIPVRIMNTDDILYSSKATLRVYASCRRVTMFSQWSVEVYSTRYYEFCNRSTSGSGVILKQIISIIYA